MPRTLLKRLAPESVSTLLVIYAGGTLGMLRSKQGYVVGPGFLYASRASISRACSLMFSPLREPLSRPQRR